MKAIYFPFTYLPESIYQMVHAICTKPVLLQASRRQMPSRLKDLEKEKNLDIIAPTESDQALDFLLNDYHQWAQIHQGELSDFTKSPPPQLPFFNETSSAQIRSDIRQSMKGERNKPAGPETPDTFLLARAFLVMAQAHDEHQYDLTKDLGRFQQMEKKLFAEMKGDDTAYNALFTESIPISIDSVTDHMPEERLNAWIRLFAHTVSSEKTTLQLEDGFFFVTNSAAVMDHIREKTFEIETALHVTGISVTATEGTAYHSFCKDFKDKIRWLETSPKATDGSTIAYPSTPNTEHGNRLTVYRIIEKSPKTVLETLAGTALPKLKTLPPFQHTLIGVFENRESAAQ